jgi:hypothetical protein
MPVILKNNAFSTLATAITTSDTGIVVASGSAFPALSAGEYFYVTLVSQAGTTEIIKVTARVGNSMTVVRAQDGSTAASFQVGTLVEMRVNAASIAELRDEAAEITIADAGGYYGPSNVEDVLQLVGLVLQGNITRDSVTSLLADTSITYTAGGLSSVTAGDIVRTSKEGFAYSVAASGATDQHVTTAGGVKLYVLLDSESKRPALAYAEAVPADWGDPINRALADGQTVTLPERIMPFTTTILVPAGSTLSGVNVGRITNTNPADRGGSTLLYQGAGDAVRVLGTNAGLERVRVEGSINALGSGIVLDGDGRIVESWKLRDIVIFGFTGGTGLKLHGENNGAVVYGHCENLRIRNCKTGIHIFDVNSIFPHTGDFGFANTNQFYGGAISGGGYDQCILVEGGNDNQFSSMTIEPFNSVNAHILRIRGSIIYNGRIEAATKSPTQNLINIQPYATQSGGSITGLISTNGRVLNDGITDLSFQGAKFAAPNVVGYNRFRNSAFKGADIAARTIPNWTVTETGGASTWARVSDSVIPGHEVLEVTVPASGRLELRQLRAIGTSINSATITSGIWVKSTAANLVTATYNAPAGLTTSGLYPGNDVWQPVSMVAARTTGSDDPKFFFDGGASGATFLITAPFFSINGRADASANLLTAGGEMSGTIEGGGAVITLPSTGSNEFYDDVLGELLLPKWGNRFVIAGTARTINRINNVGSYRFARYTKIDLIFDISSVVITSSAYILLRSSFTSSAGSVISLYEATGAGVWREMLRG